MGLTFAPGPERVAKLKEFVALFKAHCTGDVMDHEGRYAVASGYTGLPLPVQQPHPPIMIGGSRKVVLSFAAREAEIVSLNNVDFVARNDDGLTPHEESLRRLEYVRTAAGDRFASLDIESSPFFTRVTDDAEAAAEEIAGYVRFPATEVARHPNVLIGTVDAIVDQLHERRAVYGFNYVSVQQSELEAFAPVVARLAGA
jgi:alkanesulfonate monooxygenase SsuD/methylene tetrahydromethanopterin reductase-like flavin-dependent oxidoreductase (luciferase family)